jgi:hypothetical protein
VFILFFLKNSDSKRKPSGESSSGQLVSVGSTKKSCKVDDLISVKTIPVTLSDAQQANRIDLDDKQPLSIGVFNAAQFKLQLASFLRDKLNDDVRMNSSITGNLSVEFVNANNSSSRSEQIAALNEFLAQNFSHKQMELSSRLSENKEAMIALNNRLLELNSRFTAAHFRFDSDKLIQAFGSKKSIEKCIHILSCVALDHTNHVEEVIN